MQVVPLFGLRIQQITMKTPEAYEKDDICKYLDTINAWYFRPFMAGYGKSGVADIIACLDGTFWSIEVKREDKEPTKLQYRRMAEVLKAGGKVAWGTANKVIAEIQHWRLYG
jgi:Holliday junction resolvase